MKKLKPSKSILDYPSLNKNPGKMPKGGWSTLKSREPGKKSGPDYSDMNEWVPYGELKDRWRHVFQTGEDFLKGRRQINLMAFRWADTGDKSVPPFLSFTPQTADDLKRCWFVRWHVTEKERDYGFLFVDTPDQKPTLTDAQAAQQALKNAARIAVEKGEITCKEDLKHHPNVKKIQTERNWQDDTVEKYTQGIVPAGKAGRPRKK